MDAAANHMLLVLAAPDAVTLKDTTSILVLGTSTSTSKIWWSIKIVLAQACQLDPIHGLGDGSHWDVADLVGGWGAWFQVLLSFHPWTWAPNHW